MGFTIHEDTTAQSSVADGYNHEILQTMSTAIGFLTKRCDMCVISQSHSQSQTVLQHRSQGHNALPRHIGCMFNTARHKVSARSTHTDRANFFITAILLYQHDDFLTEHTDIVGYVRIVHRIKVVRRDYFTTDIHQCKGGPHLSNVDTDNSGFNLIYRFHTIKYIP